MEYIYDKVYKDWEKDPLYFSTENHKFYKKGDERVEITIYDDAIVELKKNVKTPYVIVKSYYPNKRLRYSGKNFYQIHCGKWLEYNEGQRLIRETDWDEPYKFSIADVIKKIEVEYDVDLNNINEGCNVERFIAENDIGPVYEVMLKSKDDFLKRDYLLIDGLTGVTLFVSYYFVNGEGRNLFREYLKSHDEKVKDAKIVYKTKDGKDYNKEEWKEYEQEFYNEWKRKQGKK